MALSWGFHRAFIAFMNFHDDLMEAIMGVSLFFGLLSAVAEGHSCSFAYRFDFGIFIRIEMVSDSGPSKSRKVFSKIASSIFVSEVQSHSRE